MLDDTQEVHYAGIKASFVLPLFVIEMNKKLLILLIVITLLVVAIPLTLFVINQQQDIRSNASTELSDTSVLPTNTPIPTTAATVSPTAACSLPTQVINVKMEYPGSLGGTSYDFTKATCTWDAVNGATSYSIKITQVESSSVVKTDTVATGTTTYTFAVTANNTYKCEISAVNSCGTGPAGSDQLLCKTDTIPTTAPTVTTAPTTVPTVAPTTTTAAACGSPCTNGTTCAAGLTCVTAANSTRYCAITAYQNACALSPSVGSCCTAPSAPTSAPTVILPTQLPPTGVTTTTIWLGLGGIAITIVGGLLLLL